MAVKNVCVAREKNVQLPVPLATWRTPMAATVRAAIVLFEVLVVIVSTMLQVTVSVGVCSPVVDELKS